MPLRVDKRNAQLEKLAKHKVGPANLLQCACHDSARTLEAFLHRQRFFSYLQTQQVKQWETAREQRGRGGTWGL